MKRLLVVAVTVIAALFLTSCNKEKEISKIVGMWEVSTVDLTLYGQTLSMSPAEAGMEAELTFNEDGTGTAKTKDFTENFTYTYADDVITVISDGETEIIPISINDKTMTIMMDDFMIDGITYSVKIHLVKK